MSFVSQEHQSIGLGEDFLSALKARDFDRLEACFHPNIHFRALVPSGIREGTNAREAGAWLRRWFDDADEFQPLTSSVDKVADRLHINYRFRVRKGIQWQLIEQQVYCSITDGRIEVLNLLCSGFRPDLDYLRGEERRLME